MINSKTHIVGLFGNPVDHSLSPFFMNYTLKNLGLNFRYFAFSIDSKAIYDAVLSVRSLKFRGVNITIPYKRDVIRYIDRIDDNAKPIGAVNCILNDNNTLIGYNTDYLGFIKPFKDRDIYLSNKRAIIIGCGGVSRAVTYTLINNDISNILVVNRTKKNAFDFIKWAKEEFGFNDISYIGDRTNLTQLMIDKSDIIINTTPIGMYPKIDDSPVRESVRFHKNQVVYDLVYKPWETRLIKNAKKSGALALNGFEMLIIQGLYSLAIWFPERKKDIFLLKDSIMDFTKHEMFK